MYNHISFVLRKNTINDNKYFSLNKHNLDIIIKFKHISLNFANLFLKICFSLFFIISYLLCFSILKMIIKQQKY